MWRSVREIKVMTLKGHRQGERKVKWESICICIQFVIKQVDGKTTYQTIEPVKYYQQAKVLLFSMTLALSKDVVLTVMIKTNFYQARWKRIVFDWWIKTHNGWVCGFDVLSYEAQSFGYSFRKVDSVMMREVNIIKRNEHSKNKEKITELLRILWLWMPDFSFHMS